MQEWKDFFDKNGGEVLTFKTEIIGTGVMTNIISFEELYQIFKNRMLVELETEHGDLLQSR